MRAYTFTNYAGRFLYVEAHNALNTSNSGPTMSGSYAGADGVYRPSTNFGNAILPDGNDAAIGGNKIIDAGRYMYHRALIALRGDDANLQASQVTVRVASSTGAYSKTLTFTLSTTTP